MCGVLEEHVFPVNVAHIPSMFRPILSYQLQFLLPNPQPRSATNNSMVVVQKV